jgi:hypothetical protein
MAGDSQLVTQPGRPGDRSLAPAWRASGLAAPAAFGLALEREGERALLGAALLDDEFARLMGAVARLSLASASPAASRSKPVFLIFGRPSAAFAATLSPKNARARRSKRRRSSSPAFAP